MLSYALIASCVALAQSQGSTEGSCGIDKPSKVPDCERVDYGSCGNACCKLDFTSPAGFDATSIKDRMVEQCTNRGPDNGYSCGKCAGPLDKCSNGFESLKDNGAGDNDWIGQVLHTTKGNYTDAIQMFIGETGDKDHPVHIRIFSNARIVGGSTGGDHGQNYKNIINLLKAVLKDKFDSWEMVNSDDSCPPPSKVAPTASAEEEAEEDAPRALARAAGPQRVDIRSRLRAGLAGRRVALHGEEDEE